LRLFVASRKVLAHKVAITLDAWHAKEVIEQAFLRHGTPEIVNTDQGSQFTATEFTDVVLAKGSVLSMDRRDAWRDNVFVKRLWRSVKYQRVYLRAYDSVTAARTDIAQYIDGFNKTRPHSSLKDATPDEFYYANLPKLKEAAEDVVIGAPRVAHRVGRFAASDHRRRGQHCTVCNLPAVHLKLGGSCSNKRGDSLLISPCWATTRLLVFNHDLASTLRLLSL
jgi:hypothetical protein